MTDPASKRCLLCGGKGTSEHANDFIHHGCASPDRVTIACAGCGYRLEYAPSDADVREFFARTQIPAIPRGGLVVIVDSCPVCPQGAAEDNCRLFSVAAE